MATSCGICEYSGIMWPGTNIVPGRVTSGSSITESSSKIVLPLISSRSVPKYWNQEREREISEIYITNIQQLKSYHL